jgi:two-component system sensor histidine kinase TctE
LSSAPVARRPRGSLRGVLLLGILLPVLALVALNTVSLYRQALRAANVAYDRTLLASAKSLGEQLEVSGSGGDARLRATVPYAALEPFEADNRSRMFYRVSGFAGEMVSGFENLPPWRGTLPAKGPYAALVDFYDDRYLGEPVRVAVLLQPVAGQDGRGMATIQVAETLELRQTLARQILFDTLWRQLLLLLVITAVVVWVVQRATRPVRELSAQLLQRGENDLAPIDAPRAPRELLPLIEATNQVMARLEHLLSDQKRFVRDTAHQLRTPLAVLRTQLQSAQRGDVAPEQAMQEMGSTVERATELANQMLALAKVEQLRRQGEPAVVDWAELTRAVALDLAPLIAQQQLDFNIHTVGAPVRAHEWALRELTRNLLHNAIKHGGAPGRVEVVLAVDARVATLRISDSGPGIAEELRRRLFQPFASGDPRSGSGLGLAICQDIVRSLGGEIRLDSRIADGRTAGLDAVVSLPLADNAAA